jgi:hypothetical protein
MTWLLIGVVVWIAVAVPAALVIGRAIRTADARRAGELEALADAEEANFVATEAPPSEVPPSEVPRSEVPSTPWTGPSTVPFPPPPPASRQRPSIVRHPVSRKERNPSPRDSGVV